MDGWLVEFADGDREVIEDWRDVDLEDTGTPFVVIGGVEMLFSVDHGLRTADETAYVIGTSLAAEILAPLVDFMSGRRVWEGSGVFVELPEDIHYEGGWADDPADSQYLYEWSQEMEDAASSLGLIVETSGDVGMTWAWRMV